MIQLPELYSKHLKKQFNYSQYLVLVILINLLQDLQTVRLEELGRRFPVPIQLRSRVKKLQRLYKRNYKNRLSKEPWYILTNLDNLSAATFAYSKRMGIEEMFRDFKLGGYNLEVTQVGDHRLISTIILITLAYFLSILSGQLIKQKGVAKYVVRPTDTKSDYESMYKTERNNQKVLNAENSLFSQSF